ncbi:hypothetical protein [Streptomyces olivoreticuli]|uniref:hypothetical protein n=1 Tax=Streptomyces olivoreticuli TaxID=68246 RepID=UPI000E230FBA|nr:hypothetical protein [Streptomyces olivoreticuli]
MKSLRTILTGAAIAALTVTAAPFVAQATEVAPRPGGQGHAQVQADGRLYAYVNRNYDSAAGWCSWQGDSADWGSCKNWTSSVWNNRYPGALDFVWVHYNSNNQGARRGIYNGVALPDLRDWTFDAGTGAGSGQALDNNIASHQVTNAP